MARYLWHDVARTLADQPPGTRVRIARRLAQHPRDAGMRPSFGLPAGQQADYRLALADCRGLHVQDFSDYYEAHVDQTDPGCDALLHLAQDAPASCVAGSALLGAAVGLLLGRSGNSMLAGLVIGAGFGGLAAASAAQAPGASPRFNPRSGG